MTTPSIGFIGGGRITRIFLEAWTRAGATPHRIVIADPDQAQLDRLKAKHPGLVTTLDPSVAAAQDLVLLATHPPAIPDLLKLLQGSLRPDTLLLSLAPKFTIEKLSSLLGGHTRIARSNPNAPSLVGAGFNPVAFHASLSAKDRELIRSLLKPLGESPEVDEAKIEAFAVFTAMGPTYLWFQMQALRELAVSFGLTAEEADQGLKSMVNGAARTLVDSSLTPSEVMDLVPVKPLAEMEPQVLEFYRTRLPALFEKIKP